MSGPRRVRVELKVALVGLAAERGRGVGVVFGAEVLARLFDLLGGSGRSPWSIRTA